MRNILAQFKCTKYSESEGIVDDTMSQSASIDEFGDGELPPNPPSMSKSTLNFLKSMFRSLLTNLYSSRWVAN